MQLSPLPAPPRTYAHAYAPVPTDMDRPYASPHLQQLHGYYRQMRVCGFRADRFLCGYIAGVAVLMLLSGLTQFALTDRLIDMRYILVSDHALAQNFPAFTIAQETWLDIPIGPVIAYFSVMDGLFMAALASLFYGFRPQIERGLIWLIWVNYATTVPVMVSVIAQLCGARNLGYHVLLGVTFQIMMLTGIVIQWDRYENTTSGLWPGKKIWSGPMRLLFFLHSVTFTVGWGSLLYYFFRAADSSAPPAFVYVSVLGLLALMLPFPLIMLLELGAAMNMYAVTFMYVTASLVSKTVISWDLFIGAGAQ